MLVGNSTDETGAYLNTDAEPRAMTDRTLAFSSFPLSSDFRFRFEQATGCHPNYFNLVEQFELGITELIRKLRSLQADRLFLLIEDENNAPFLPYLILLSALSDGHLIEVMYPDLRLRPVRRARAIPSLAAIALASAAGQIAMRSCRRELRDLLTQPRTEFPMKPSQRILYLYPNLAFGLRIGGSVGHVAGVVNGLLRHGMAVDFVSASQPVLIDPRARVYALQLPKVFGVPTDANTYRFHHMILDQAGRLLNQNTYACIYSRLSTGSYADIVLARKARLPLILEYNGSVVQARRSWKRPLRYQDLTLQAEEVCLKHAHLVVTVSEVLRDELLERGIEPRRIVYYPNCVDPAIFDPARYSEEARAEVRQRHLIPSDATVVTFLGTFGPWHGIEVLAEAIRQMVDEDSEWLRGNRVRFLLIGDGQCMPAVRALLGTSPYDSFVTLTGLVPQDQAPCYLATSDIVVASHARYSDGSRFHGSPTKLFEYMAMAKGIVASDLDQIGQVLKNSLRVEDLPAEVPNGSETDLAVLTPPGDRDGLVQGIRFLVRQPQWRRLLGRNARREALTHYTWDKHVGAILQALSVTLTADERPMTQSTTGETIQA